MGITLVKYIRLLFKEKSIITFLPNLSLIELSPNINQITEYRILSHEVCIERFYL